MVRVQPSEGVEDALRLLGVVLDHGHVWVVCPLIRSERAVHGASSAVIEVVDDGLQVNAHGQRVPDALVGEHRVPRVPGDVVVCERVEAPEVDRFRQLRPAAFHQPRVGSDHRLIDIAALHGVPCRPVIDDHFEQNLLQIRPLAPVFGAPLEQDLFPRLTAHQAIGSAADGPGGEVGFEIALRVDMLGKHQQVVEVRELGGQLLLEGHGDGVVVDDLRVAEVELFEASRDLRRLILRIDDLLQREQDIAGSHRRPIGERGARIQMERVELAVRCDVPLLRQAGNHLQIHIEVHHRREEEEGDESIVAARGEDRIQRGDVALQPADDRAAFLWRRFINRGGRRKRAFIAAGEDEK